MKLFSLWSLSFILVIIGGTSKPSQAGFFNDLIEFTVEIFDEVIHLPGNVAKTVLPGKLGREAERIMDQVAPVVIAAVTGGTASAVIAGVSQVAQIAKIKNVEKIASFASLAVNIGSARNLAELAKAAAKESVIRADDINRKVLNGKLGDLRWLEAVGTAAMGAAEKGGDLRHLLKDTGRRVITDNLELINEKLLGGHDSDLARLSRIATSTMRVVNAPTNEQRVSMVSDIVAHHVDGLTEVVKIANSAGSILEAAKTGSRQVIADAILTTASKNLKGMDEALRIAGIVRDVASNSADRGKLLDILDKETSQKLKLNELNRIVDVVVNASLLEKSRDYLVDNLLRESGKILNELGDLAKIVDAVQIAVSNKSKDALMEALFSEVASKVDPEMAKLVETVQTIATKNLTGDYLISEAARQLNHLAIVSKISDAVADTISLLNNRTSLLASNFDEELGKIDGFTSEMTDVLNSFRKGSLDELLLLEAARLVGHREVVSKNVDKIKAAASTQIDNDLGAILMAETAKILSGRPEFIEIAEAIQTTVTGDVRRNIEATLLCDAAKLAVLQSNSSLEVMFDWLDAQDNMLATTLLLSESTRQQVFNKDKVSRIIASSLVFNADALAHGDSVLSGEVCFNGTEICSNPASDNIAGLFMTNLARQFDPSVAHNATLVEDELQQKITSDVVAILQTQISSSDRSSLNMATADVFRNQLAAAFVEEACRFLAANFNSSTNYGKTREFVALQKTDRNGEMDLLRTAMDKVDETLSPRNLSKVRRAIEKASSFDGETLRLLRVSWEITADGKEDNSDNTSTSKMSGATMSGGLSSEIYAAIFVPIALIVCGAVAGVTFYIVRRRHKL